jgi:L,D-peptidoglycan transpeptidase YkuD (ErfK/YbiS/YcfS/YnhG family)
MDVAPTISNGRTYVPACYIAEALGYNVSWDSSNQAVIIATSKPGAAGQVLGLLNAMKNPVFADSKQVLTVTSQYPSSQHATVNAYEKINGRWTLVYANMRSLIGQNGMVNDAERRQDTNTTPSGIYDIVFAFGWAANPGTKLPYRLADNNSYWDENSGSPTYNRWVESNPGGDNEQLKNQPLYKYDSPAETPDDLPVIA